MKKSITIVAILILIVAASFIFIKTTPSGIDTANPVFPVLLVASSLVDSVNPCAFSVLLITVAFLASLGAARKKMLGIGFAYIAGIFSVYLLIGGSLLKALDVFGVPHVMGKVGAAVLLFFGISNVIGHYFPDFPIEFKIPKAAHDKMAPLIQKASVPAAFFLGVLVALFEFPCTGGPYLLILGLIHDGAEVLKGVAYLLLYNVIFVLPLILILFAASNPALLVKVEEWKKRAAGKGKLYTGLVMVLLGLLIFWFS